MGLTLGVLAAPCIGPFLIGLLTYVASTGNPYLGFVLFFTLSLGLGIPLATLAFFSGKLDRLPRSGEWMIWVRKLLGWVLVAMAVMVDEEIVVEGTDISEDGLEKVICKHLGLPPPTAEKKGMLGRLFR